MNREKKVKLLAKFLCKYKYASMFLYILNSKFARKKWRKMSTLRSGKFGVNVSSKY